MALFYYDYDDDEVENKRAPCWPRGNDSCSRRFGQQLHDSQYLNVGHQNNLFYKNLLIIHHVPTYHFVPLIILIKIMSDSDDEIAAALELSRDQQQPVRTYYGGEVPDITLCFIFNLSSCK